LYEPKIFTESVIIRKLDVKPKKRVAELFMSVSFLLTDRFN